jgi:hypothetical protein
MQWSATSQAREGAQSLNLSTLEKKVWKDPHKNTKKADGRKLELPKTTDA